MKRYTAEELHKLKTIAEGQADDLKIEISSPFVPTRVWISRCTIEDGEPYNNKISIEKLKNGMWKLVDEYEG